MKWYIPHHRSESVVKWIFNVEDTVDHDPAGLLLFNELGDFIPDPVIGRIEYPPDCCSDSLQLRFHRLTCPFR